MIALLTDPDWIYRGLIAFTLFIFACIVVINAIDAHYKHEAKKIRRQRILDAKTNKDRIRAMKEDEAAGQYIIDQARENYRDFDDAS